MSQRLTGGSAPYYPPLVSEPNGASNRWSSHCQSPLRKRAFHIDMMCVTSTHIPLARVMTSFKEVKKWIPPCAKKAKTLNLTNTQHRAFLLASRTLIRTTIAVLTLHCNCLVIVSIPSEDTKLLKDRHSALPLYPIATTVCGTYTHSVKELEWRIQRPLF